MKPESVKTRSQEIRSDLKLKSAQIFVHLPRFLNLVTS